MKCLLLLVCMVTATSAYGEIYTWKDTRGTSHYTNQPDTIPPKYRSRVKVLAIPSEQKAAPSPAQQGQAQPSASPSVALPMPPPPPVAAPRQAPVRKERLKRNEQRRRGIQEE